MSKKAKSIPLNFFLPEYTLERAAEAMTLCVKPYKVAPDDFMLWWKSGTIDLCYEWGEEWSENGFVVPDYDQFIAATKDYTTYYDQFKEMDDIYGSFIVAPEMSVRPYTYKIANDNWMDGHPGYSYIGSGMLERNVRYIKFEHSKADLRVPPPEMAKVYRLITLFHEKRSPEPVPEPSGYEERFARDRLQFLQMAVRILSDYPDECRGPKKEISPEKWADAVEKHRHKLPRLNINSPGTFLKHLRMAVNYAKKDAQGKGGE